MRKVLKNLIGLLIIVLLVVGFKSYTIYYYEPVETDVHIGSKVKIQYNKTNPNHKLEALSYYLEDSYKTSDSGETYTWNGSLSTTEEPVEKSDSSIQNESVPTSAKTITFEVKHNVMENLSVEDQKLQKIDYLFLMKYSKLENEKELIQYYIKTKENKNKITDFIYQIKTKYLSSIFVKGMNLEKEIKELDGLDGYLVQDSTSTKAILFHQGNSYEVTFSEEFTETEIQSILNTFVFE